MHCVMLVQEIWGSTTSLSCQPLFAGLQCMVRLTVTTPMQDSRLDDIQSLSKVQRKAPCLPHVIQQRSKPRALEALERRSETVAVDGRRIGADVVGTE